MTSEFEPDQEVQHATVTVDVAIAVDKDAPEDVRCQQIEAAVRAAIEDNDDLEYRLCPSVGLTRTETIREAMYRLADAAESEAIARAERRAERYFEQRGGY